METVAVNRHRLPASTCRHTSLVAWTELGPPTGVERYGVRINSPVFHDFELRSLPACLDEILGRFSSSLPPPSFARGRFATIFSSTGVAERGTRCVA
jgi:hypothetical protein